MVNVPPEQLRIPPVGRKVYFVTHRDQPVFVNGKMFCCMSQSSAMRFAKAMSMAHRGVEYSVERVEIMTQEQIDGCIQELDY